VKWNVENKARALGNTILFKEVMEQDIQELVPFTRTIVLESDQILFSLGDTCEGLYVVLEGRTRAVRHGSDGREQVIHEDRPFSTYPEVAVFDNGPNPSSVVAVENSVLLFIPKSRIKKFCLQHPEVAMSALEVLSKRLRKATGMVEDLSLKDVSQRLAEFLLEQVRLEIGTQEHLELRHSNQQIADTIGTVREVVSRAFTKLQRKNWILKEGRSVEILDLEALADHIHGILE